MQAVAPARRGTSVSNTLGSACRRVGIVRSWRLTTPHKLRTEARRRKPTGRRPVVRRTTQTDGRGRQLHAVVMRPTHPGLPICQNRHSFLYGRIRQALGLARGGGEDPAVLGPGPAGSRRAAAAAAARRTAGLAALTADAEHRPAVP